MYTWQAVVRQAMGDFQLLVAADSLQVVAEAGKAMGVVQDLRCLFRYPSLPPSPAAEVKLDRVHVRASGR